MNDKQARYEKIEKFLAGKLPEEEQRDFKRELNEDKNLAEELRLHRDIQDSINDVNAAEVAIKIKQIGQEFLAERKEEKHKVKFLSGKKWLIAASVALLIAFVSILFFSRLQEDALALFENHYEVPLLLERSRSDELAVAESLEKAYDFYMQQNFGQALLQFESLQQTGISLERINLFYIGICQFETRNYKAAIQSLDKIRFTENHAYKDAAKWYIALIYLKQEQLEKARSMLVELVGEGSGKYQKKGKLLLNQITK